MRVTSVIGDTGRAKVSTGQRLPNPLGRLRNLFPADASHLLTRQILSATEEAIDESTSRLATNPRLLRHAARHRALAGPTRQRRRAAPPAPARPALPRRVVPVHGRARQLRGVKGVKELPLPSRWTFPTTGGSLSEHLPSRSLVPACLLTVQPRRAARAPRVGQRRR